MSPPTNTDAERAFFTAVKSGDLVAVRQQAATNPALLGACDHDEFGAPPHNLVAGHRRNLEMVRLLLQLGADVDQPSVWPPGPWTPAQSALSQSDNDAIVAELLAAGATIDAHVAAGTDKLKHLQQLLDAVPALVHARGGDGCLPLHFAATPRIVDYLLDHGADPDARDVDHHSTALQWLAPRHPTAARQLIARGAHPDPFAVVACGDADTLAAMLADNPDCSHWRMSDDYYPKGPNDALNILSFTVGQNATLLHAAATGNHPDLVHPLVAAGIDPNAPGAYDDCTALHLAAWHDFPEVAAALITAGADIDANSGAIHQNTPLGWAIVAGSAKVAKLLLDHGCEVRDYHRSDAQLAIDGEFRAYKAAPIANHRRILTLLSKATNSQ